MSDFSLWALILVVCGLSYVLLSLLWSTWRLGIGPTTSGLRARQDIAHLAADLVLEQPFNQVIALDSLSSATQKSAPKTQYIYELGSGWGGLSFYLAKTLKSYLAKVEEVEQLQILIKGYELAQVPYVSAKIIQNLRQVLSFSLQNKQATKEQATSSAKISLDFIQQDFITELDQVEAGAVLIAYLCPKQMERIAEALRQRDKPIGAYLISLTFALPGHQARQTKRVANLFRDPLYLYLI